MTPHINAEKKDIAKIVLMPGDPLRAKFIAENFLDNYRLVNDVRNMFMYTGTYHGKEITIAGSGMGCPSIGIYSYELFKFYDVECIIRIGSAGSYVSELDVYDLVNVTSAYGENNYAKIVAGLDDQVLSASSEVVDLITTTAQGLGLKLKNARVHSSDVFYRQNPDDWKKINKEYDALCVEMESFALFANARALNKKAGCLLTISDSFISGAVTTAAERQNNFKKMMELALEAIIKF
ncbi:purine nucleoside phosphorylase [Spiroplasma syrphidicola EA-1]|uniref:Uridine phosphorylase n=1 Tax=Spiroplasma syrphidicola EA-1 TaxID=1276229 RepID=R4U378_9MOLU|nr:purine-nucleoside phosphorylase [Spiroplasma syrphidicola]AGM25847.1 purine nucleoside phosphorylase [Spiroplasma syrphidicola EA-1]